MSFTFPTGTTRAYDSRISGAQFAEGYFSPHIFPKRLLKKFDKELVMKSCINEDWAGDIKGYGDVVHIRDIGDVSIVPYDRYDEISYQSLDEDEKLLTITEQDMFAFEIDPLDEEDFDINVLEKYTNRAAYNLADHVDQYLLTVGINGASNANSLTGQTITQDNIYQILTECYKNLRVSKAFQARKDAWLVGSPTLEMLLSNCPQFVPTNTGGASTESGVAKEPARHIGKIANFNVKITHNIEEDTDGSETMLFGTNEGITFAQKVAKVERIKQRELKFGQAVRGLFYYGAKVLYSNCLGTLEGTLNLSSTT